MKIEEFEYEEEEKPKKQKVAKQVGNHAVWDLNKNDYIIQTKRKATIELLAKGLSRLAEQMYGLFAYRLQLSIKNNWKITEENDFFHNDYFINYLEKKLGEDLCASTNSLGKAFQELSSRGYAVRYRAGGRDSRTPSKIILFSVDRPFTGFKYEIGVRIVNLKTGESKIRIETRNLWKKVQEKLLKEPDCNPHDLWLEAKKEDKREIRNRDTTSKLGRKRQPKTRTEVIAQRPIETDSGSSNRTTVNVPKKKKWPKGHPWHCFESEYEDEIL